MMRGNLASLMLVGLLALVAAGCATVSRASVQQGDIVTSAEVERLAQPGVFRTHVMIVQVDAAGSERVLAAPTVISREGETATISVENDAERITVLVRIPMRGNVADGAQIDIKIEQHGKLVSAPRMTVQVPG
jgi:hypothetical protein